MDIIPVDIIIIITRGLRLATQVPSFHLPSRVDILNMLS